MVVRTSFRGAPRRIIFNASSTASLGRVCAGDGDVGSASRLGDALAFATKHPPVSRDASIAQTDAQHLPDARPIFYGKHASPEGDEWSRIPSALLVSRLGVRVWESQPSVTLATDSGRMKDNP